MTKSRLSLVAFFVLLSLSYIVEAQSSSDAEKSGSLIGVGLLNGAGLNLLNGNGLGLLGSGSGANNGNNSGNDNNNNNDNGNNSNNDNGNNNGNGNDNNNGNNSKNNNGNNSNNQNSNNSSNSNGKNQVKCTQANRNRQGCPKTLKRVCGYLPNGRNGKSAASYVSFNNPCLACRNTSVASYTVGAC